jgi:hypothetical protein
VWIVLKGITVDKSKDIPQDQESILRTILTADQSHFREEFRRNEDLGERRLQIFTTLITAVVGGLVFLATKDNPPKDLPFLIFVGSGFLTAVGALTYRRLVRRDQVTDEYKHYLDMTRRGLLCLSQKPNDAKEIIEAYSRQLAREETPQIKKRIGELAKMTRWVTLGIGCIFLASLVVLVRPWQC